MAHDPLLHWKCVKAAAGMIQALAIDGIGERVGIQIVPDETAYYRADKDQVITFDSPVILLTLDGEVEEKEIGSTEATEWGWPARVWVADKSGPRNHGKAPIYLGARKAVLDLWDDPQREVPLTGVPECWGVRVTPGVVFDPRLPNYQHIVSGLLLRFLTTESRL